jgi:hypothetical protein
MVDDLVFHERLLRGRLWLCLIRYGVGLWRRAVTDQAPGHIAPWATRHAPDPKPFPGLTIKPRCRACESGHSDPPLAAPPPRLHCSSGRPRTVVTHHPFCPEPPCRYDGWVGRGNIRANGHPGGGPWRQLSGVACGGYVLETPGTPLHGRRVPTQLIVWAVGALAEGLGIRAVARVFGVDPNPVLPWFVDAAEHAAALSRSFLRHGRVAQGQRDALWAWLSAVKTGQVSAAEVLPRLSRSPHWGWGAIDPVTKLLWALDIGDRPLEMAQRLVHGITDV